MVGKQPLRGVETIHDEQYQYTWLTNDASSSVVSLLATSTRDTTTRVLRATTASTSTTSTPSSTGAGGIVSNQADRERREMNFGAVPQPGNNSEAIPSVIPFGYTPERVMSHHTILYRYSTQLPSPHWLPISFIPIARSIPSLPLSSTSSAPSSSASSSSIRSTSGESKDSEAVGTKVRSPIAATSSSNSGKVDEKCGLCHHEKAVVMCYECTKTASPWHVLLDPRTKPPPSSTISPTSPSYHPGLGATGAMPNSSSWTAQASTLTTVTSPSFSPPTTPVNVVMCALCYMRLHSEPSIVKDHLSTITLVGHYYGGNLTQARGVYQAVSAMAAEILRNAPTSGSSSSSSSSTTTTATSSVRVSSPINSSHNEANRWCEQILEPTAWHLPLRILHRTPTPPRPQLFGFSCWIQSPCADDE
jgi:hypothetical protein